MSKEVTKKIVHINVSRNVHFHIDINNFLIKDFMKAHGGFTREEIQDWMNLAWFLLSKPENRYEKVDKFMNMAAKCSQNVKYRQVFKRKLK